MWEWMYLETYHLNILSLLTITVAVLISGFGVISIIRSRYSYNAYTLFFLNINISLWLIFFALSYSSANESLAFYWLNKGYIFVPLIAPAVYLFTCSFLESTEKRRQLTLVFFIIGFGFAILQTQSHLLFNQTNQYSWGYYTKYKLNSATYLFLIFFFGVALFSTYEVILSYLKTPKSNSINKKRLKMLLLSLTTGLMASIDYAPGFGFDVYPIGIFFLLAYISILSYAVEKYHILDINTFVTQKILQTMNDALIICDKNGHIHIANRHFEALSQYDRNDLIGAEISNILLIDDQQNACKKTPFSLNNLFQFGTTEAQIIRKDNKVVPASISYSQLSSTKHKTDGWIIIARDITDYKNNIDKLMYVSSHDYLTNIFNRKRFEESFIYQIDYSKRNNVKSALFVFDIDHFKEINDSFGHQFGDKLLIEFSQLLKRNLRKTDVLGRIGGDEFAAIITNISIRHLDKIASKILKLISSHQFIINHQKVFISTSIGISIIPDHGCDYESLFTNADLSLYHCKIKNRNSYMIYTFDNNWNNAFKDKLLLANIIKDAIKNDQLILHAQPIWNMTQESCTHFELLLRINHENKLILPNDFLSVAEHYGLMNEINLYVLSTTIQLIHKHPSLTFSCNLSANAFNDAEILKYLTLSAQRKEFNPKQMIIEITEDTVATHIDLATTFINKLKSLGINFALDDFGVGLSSFTHLKKIPVDYLKIDGSFVQNICQDKIDQQFVKSMIDISRAMNIRTIAEYVSNKNIESVLRQMGIDYSQGYYRGKPMALNYWLKEFRVKKHL